MSETRSLLLLGGPYNGQYARLDSDVTVGNVILLEGVDYEVVDWDETGELVGIWNRDDLEGEDFFGDNSE